MEDSPYRLRWDTVAPGNAFHAALVTTRQCTTRLHNHDFHEIVWVEEGKGTHHINGQAQPIAAGDLLFIRPNDAHTFSIPPGQNLYFVNIAFRSELWAAFAALAELTEWDVQSAPPSTHLHSNRRSEARQCFGNALRAFHAGSGQSALCRFWAVATELLSQAEETQHLLPANAPVWLSRACQLMVQEDNLRSGLHHLLDLCGVSEAHLARTLKAACGLTPTEWINKQRLDRAAILLATSTLPILDISVDCGFENLSYFYRRFGQQFGQSPRAYRLSARSRILPDAANTQ